MQQTGDYFFRVDSGELVPLERDDIKDYVQCIREKSLPGKLLGGILCAGIALSPIPVKPPNIVFKKICLAFGTYLFTSLAWTVMCSGYCKNYITLAIEKHQVEKLRKEQMANVSDNEEDKTNFQQSTPSTSTKYMSDFDFTPNYTINIDSGAPLNFNSDSQNEKEGTETKKPLSYDQRSYLNRKEYYSGKKETWNRTPYAQKTEYDNELIDGVKQGKRVNKYGDIIE